MCSACRRCSTVLRLKILLNPHSALGTTARTPPLRTRAGAKRALSDADTPEKRARTDDGSTTAGSNADAPVVEFGEVPHGWGRGLGLQTRSGEAVLGVIPNVPSCIAE